MSDRGEGYNARLGVNTNEIPTAQHLPAASGAEQDRYGGWFGGKADKATEKMEHAADRLKENLPRGAGAEQERYGGWFGGKADKATEKLEHAADRLKENLPRGAGAEQERLGGWFGGKADKATEQLEHAADRIKENLPRGVGAEQERYGGWFGGDKGDLAAEKLKQNLPRGSGAEQDRYEGWFGGHELPSAEKLGEKLPRVSGAEQDRYDRWFGGDKGQPAGTWVKEHMPRASGAEQDRYAAHWEGVVDQVTDKIKEKMPSGVGAEQERLGGWFGGDKLPSASQVNEKLPKTSGAEQDRLGGWFGGDKLPSASDIKDKIPKTSGAEQDRFGGWFGGDKLPSGSKVNEHLPHASGAEQDRFGSHFGGKAGQAGEGISRRLPRVSGAEQDRYGSHFSLHPSNPVNAATTSTLGLVQNALLPSFGLHAGLSTVVYAVARYTDRAEAKDWLWPSGQVANAWWTAIGARVVHDGLSVPSAWNSLGYTQKLLLTGVSAWGARLFYRIATRSVKRGKDDARYVALKKKDPKFWDKAFFSMFLPEAALQALIALPFTLPFRAPLTSARSSAFTEFPETFHSLAVFLFTAGLALETIADSQLEEHSSKSKEINREGVWSIVRHPNYLGDALVHLSFPVLLYSAGMLHPLAVLGPAVNYIVLRYLGGEKVTEASQEERYAKENPLKFQQLQEYKRDKNSFWPSFGEYDNKWVWAVAATGVVGVAVERGLLAFFRG
ncbi:hypothetical protein BDP55DRAFT_732594 [Colletotrichum godetiae]|uniref:Duf1295 domain protein n=1 Tax=Colletotrichum godetiae TaxID=1209918 RepID=A0AAJ0ET68_9PEZI|nr:uncharacterized protein BDP55DRAFT_732594 [Colletotrichum godetiae]KAK1670975.1 hypothetical protein BDP55DRAFT_732594 [Colletotrichum godetiae]